MALASSDLSPVCFSLIAPKSLVSLVTSPIMALSASAYPLSTSPTLRFMDVPSVSSTVTFPDRARCSSIVGASTLTTDIGRVSNLSTRSSAAAMDFRNVSSTFCRPNSDLSILSWYKSISSLTVLTLAPSFTIVSSIVVLCFSIVPLNVLSSFMSVSRPLSCAVASLPHFFQVPSTGSPFSVASSLAIVSAAAVSLSFRSVVLTFSCWISSVWFCNLRSRL